ncbi:SRPBCC family protein [Arenimonas terrae]|uniref:SRPBCC domain-containing protein n=1 Tax=Arenimonas terrae TaxID=2546226 RepID=A0A5C4RU41_9GAMM|nr:SRPBCC domain-containing protein [Arenimonas terrae]TNJ34528.1 SRPBCC domain-containing protein [Arenimonas terrae]
MSASLKPPALAHDDELIIEREFDAPRAAVFKAWTDPAALALWFCPEGCDAPFQRFDPRVGGSYRVCLRGKESGTEWWMQGEFLEIVPPERIVLTHVWDDVARRPDEDSVITVRFEDLGGRTRMHFHQVRFVSVAERDDHRGGWNSCFNRLQGLLDHD